MSRLKTRPDERRDLLRLAEIAEGASAGTNFLALSDFQQFATPNLLNRLCHDFHSLEVSESNALIEMAAMYDERPSRVIQEREEMRMQRDALALLLKALKGTGLATDKRGGKTRTGLLMENLVLRQQLLEAGIEAILDRDPMPPPPGWPQGQYPVIYADPPWHFLAGITGRHAGNHYDLMDLEGIASLPVADLAAPDCALFLWVIRPMLPHAMYVARRWGFDFNTRVFNWIKTAKHSRTSIPWGMGFWSRAQAEDVWLCTKGKPRRRSTGTGVPELLVEWLEEDALQDVKWSPRQEHSRKPDDFPARMEELIAGPYLELFGRASRGPEWSVWGNEVGKMDGEQLTLSKGAARI
jgi:N6-adenosine-specific RNA methylase IME4